MEAQTFEVRRAGPVDVYAMAAAHRDSIRSLGSRFYDAEVVDYWGALVSPGLYTNAMARGEAFFVAVDRLRESAEVLGFSSHRSDAGEHGTAVYVRRKAARCGVGTALFQSAEAHAKAAGATSLEVAASLAAVEFYRRVGFEEVGRGEHALSPGRSMACVFMRKTLRHQRSGA